MVATDDYGRTIDFTDPAIQKQIEGTEDLKNKIKEHIKELEAAAEIERIRRKAIEGTVEATLEDVAALEKRNELIQGGVTTELDYLDQVAQTNAILDENGKTLDKNTEKGRDNIRALIDQSDAALQMSTSQLEAGTSADTVAANLGKQREAMLLSLDAMTGSRAESEKLAEAYGLIPKDIITEIKTNGDAETKAKIETIPATKDTTVNVDDGGTSGAVQGRVNSVTGKEVKIDVDDMYTVAAVQGRINGVTGKEVKIDVDDMYTVQAVQNRINAIRGRDLVKVDVDDDYTVRAVQDRINGIRGKDVNVNARITGDGWVEERLRQLTVTRTAYVDIVQREGKKLP
jgi:hypothetical protein